MAEAGLLRNTGFITSTASHTHANQGVRDCVLRVVDRRRFLATSSSLISLHLLAMEMYELNLAAPCPGVGLPRVCRRTRG